MKKLVNKMVSKATEMMVKLQVKATDLRSRIMQGERCLANANGGGQMDTVIGIIIAVVIGGALLAGLIVIMNGTVFPSLTQKIKDFFNM